MCYPLPPDSTLEFISDVEGNLEYFRALVERSSILSWCDGDKLAIEPNGLLVYGGDVPDKGRGDIRVARALVLLQREHPDRVFLIAGNRDVNKLRLAAELAAGEMPDRDPVPYVDTVGWEGKKQQFAEYLEARSLERTPIAALSWILEKTMGAGNALATRRAELSELGRGATDADVIRSFAEQVDPSASEPWMLEYIRATHVMVVVGDCVFMHGALRSRGLLRVPAEDCRDGAASPPPLQLPASTSLASWVCELNSWKARQLRLFEAFPRFTQLEGGERWRGGMALMMPTLSGCYLIADGWLEGGNMAPLDLDVAEYLRANGVRRIFSGHQPQGQCPGVARHPTTGVTLVCIDTSFSDVRADKSHNPSNMRGRALSSVTIRSASTRVQGVLADGTAHGYELCTRWSDDAPAAKLVGRRLNDGSWGQTVTGGGRLQTCRGEGFRQHLSLVDAADAIANLDEAFALSAAMPEPPPPPILPEQPSDEAEEPARKKARSAATAE